jgi:hypothetical protein
LADERVPPEHLVYATWLDWGTRTGLVLLVLGFLAYAFGFVEPRIPFERLTQVWGLPLADYRAATGMPAGWEWVSLVAHGDVMNMVGIAVIALVSIACYLRLLPLLAKRGEHALAYIAAAEIVVLVAASAGWIGAGH